MTDPFEQVRENLRKEGKLFVYNFTPESKTEVVNIPIIGEIVEDKKLGNKVRYYEDEVLDPKEKQRYLKMFGSSYDNL